MSSDLKWLTGEASCWAKYSVGRVASTGCVQFIISGLNRTANKQDQDPREILPQVPGPNESSE